MSAVFSLLLLVGLAEAVLLATRYKHSRALRLCLFATMFVASGVRSLQNYLEGKTLGLIDGFAMSFFGIAALMELIPLLRGRAKR